MLHACTAQARKKKKKTVRKELPTSCAATVSARPIKAYGQGLGKRQQARERLGR